jgi:ABC-type branched-subunit amino acid transport system ATPase component
MLVSPYRAVAMAAALNILGVLVTGTAVAVTIGKDIVKPEVIGQTIDQLRKSGLSILLVEQNLSMALGVSDYVYVLSKGTIVYESTPQELRANEEAQTKYLAIAE